MDWLLLTAVAGSVFFAVLRPFQPPHGVDMKDFYKDMAHIWVGLMFGTGVLYGLIFGVWGWDDFRPRNGNVYLLLAIGLTVVEVVCAVGIRVLRNRKQSLSLAPKHATARELQVGDVVYMPGPNPRQTVVTLLVNVETDKETFAMRPDETVILEK
jgi:hypothetical protein